MARLRDIKNFKGDYHNEEHYDPDNIEELKDNVLFLMERLDSGEWDEPNETVDYLKDIMKNYYGNVVMEFLD